MRLAPSLLLPAPAVLWPGCDVLSPKDDEDDGLARTCEGLVRLRAGGLSSTNGQGDEVTGEIEGHGRVYADAFGTTGVAVNDVAVTKGEVLTVTFRFTSGLVFGQQQKAFHVQGVSADRVEGLTPSEVGRMTFPTFQTFAATVRRGVNTFRYAVTVPDFQQL